ncbi:Smr/MutS family protein [Candidatus Pandoraea novymonadis]|uniref:DNA endonuclease SmrA n=1 Tax=Candidatus Pandoraea novymonadis TaxID=1808959 RepID=A0ABX5FFQ4_9BURK|nr:Smr/MutS family protein [Candidatus Pandoraea novymonadis]PSB92002.1 putative DNA endonuclease SmrA [Candidatus Pandoraea novymonadis]
MPAFNISGMRINIKTPKLTLNDLVELRDRISKDRESRDSAHKKLERHTQDALTDARIFRNSIGQITPISSKWIQNRATLLLRQLPPPITTQKIRETQSTVDIDKSLSDEFYPKGLLESVEQLAYRRHGTDRKILNQLKKGYWVIQKKLDLHGMRREEAREALSIFLHEAVRCKSRCVHIIHGKGLNSIDQKPVLKDKVRGWLAQKDEVLAYCEAKTKDGGSGALIVLLKAKQTGPHKE